MIWSALRVRQDRDQDGEVDGRAQTGELRTLNSWDITALNLAYDDGSSFEGTTDDVLTLGATLHGLNREAARAVH